MRELTFLFLVIVSVFFFTGCELHKEKKVEVPTDNPVQNELPTLTILGTFHFAGTNDFTAIVMDSVYSERRQREIDEVVLRLKQFNPNKILIEREPTLTDSLTKMFNAFLEKTYELPKNELYQIGFRLAAKSGLDSIYGVDYQMEFEDAEFSNYLNRNHLTEKFQQVIESAQIFAQKKTQLLKTSSLLQVLIDLNESKSSDFNKNLYTEHILNLTNQTGGLEVEVVSNWYKRNLKIKKNIDYLLAKNDRVLMIIGAGHKAILEDFYRSSKSINYVNINDYLEHKSE